MKTYQVTFLTSDGRYTDEVIADSLVNATAAVCRFLGCRCSDVTFHIICLS